MLTSNNLALVASTNEREITLHDLCDKYLQTLSKASINSVKYYLQDFENFISNKNISSITIDDIQSYVDYKKAICLEDSSIYRYSSALKTLFNYAVSHKYIDENPCTRS